MKTNPATLIHRIIARMADTGRLLPARTAGLLKILVTPVALLLSALVIYVLTLLGVTGADQGHITPGKIRLGVGALYVLPILVGFCLFPVGLAELITGKKWATLNSGVRIFLLPVGIAVFIGMIFAVMTLIFHRMKDSMELSFNAKGKVKYSESSSGLLPASEGRP